MPQTKSYPRPKNDLTANLSISSLMSCFIRLNYKVLWGRCQSLPINEKPCF